MSSQTTDTPGTTQTPVQDRSGATFQTYPVPAPDANPVPGTHTNNQTSPTQNRHATKTTISRLFKKGIPPPSRTSYPPVPLAATQKTIHPPNPHRKPTPPTTPTPKKPRQPAEQTPHHNKKPRPTPQNHPCAVHHLMRPGTQAAALRRTFTGTTRARVHRQIHAPGDQPWPRPKSGSSPWSVPKRKPAPAGPAGACTPETAGPEGPSHPRAAGAAGACTPEAAGAEGASRARAPGPAGPSGATRFQPQQLRERAGQGRPGATRCCRTGPPDRAAGAGGARKGAGAEGASHPGAAGRVWWLKCGRAPTMAGWGSRPFSKGCPAVTYSPTPSRVQYHRRCGS